MLYARRLVMTNARQPRGCVFRTVELDQASGVEAQLYRVVLRTGTTKQRTSSSERLPFLRPGGAVTPQSAPLTPRDFNRFRAFTAN